MLALLAGAALRSLFLAAAVGIGLRLRRMFNPLVALAAWTFVLATSLLMPVAMRLTSIALPNGIIPNDLVPDDVFLLARLPLASEATEATGRTEVWLVYLAVFGALMLRLLSGLALSWRITRAATPIREAWVEGFDVRASRRVDAPATVGSVILLPADYAAWTLARRLAVLAHEGAHVERRDFAIQLAASVNRAVFWFNPFSWWLRRHLADLAEAASDDAAIARLNDRFAYAEILLEIAGRVPALPSSVSMGGQAAVASRIKRILAETPPPADMSRHGRVLLAAGIVPLAALLCLLVVPPMPPAPAPLAAQPSDAVELASAQPASAQATAAEPASAEPASAEVASVQPTSALPSAAEPASAQPASIETASGADDAVEAKQPAAPAIAAEAIASPPPTLAPRTEAESPPPSVAVAAMPPPPSQAAARTPPRRPPPATTKNALNVPPARAMRQPSRTTGNQAVSDQAVAPVAVNAVAAHSNAATEPATTTEDGQSPVFKRVVDETCSGIYVYMGGGAARLNPVQAHFYRGPDDTPWVALYVAPRMLDKLPVTISGSEIKFTSTGGMNYTLSLSDNMMLPARYHRLTGSARQLYDGTVDVACGAPRGRPL
jgi:hypothetical protein